MKMKSCLSFFLFFICLTCFSKVDPLNAYRWNRKNVLSNNGITKTNDWFEWWYYKVIIPETKEAFFFVYGVVNPWDLLQSKKTSRAYVEMGNFQTKNHIKNKYKVTDFNAAYDQTLVEIKNNSASDLFFNGSVTANNGESSSWNISIENNWTFNAEGWASGKNLTNIEWYPAQTDAICNGTIHSGGKTYHLVNAPCYQDRNWGSSFPKWWTWIVSNHFKGHPETALAVGGGQPKYFNIGYLQKSAVVGLRHKGKVYTFRPNNFDRIKMDIKFGKWNVVAFDRRYKVEIQAYAPRESFMQLDFLTPSDGVFHDFETLTGSVTVKLYQRKRNLISRWELIDVLESDMAGIEYGSFEAPKFEKFEKLQKSL